MRVGSVVAAVVGVLLVAVAAGGAAWWGFTQWERLSAPFAYRGIPVLRMPEAPLPTARPMTGEEGEDTHGYPLRTADKLSLLALLHAGRFEELTTYIELFQADFEKDFRREHWPMDALDAFATADPEVGRRLRQWVDAAPDSFASHAALGLHYKALAWRHRGENFIGETPAMQLARMRAATAPARSHLDRALELRPSLVAAERALINLPDSTLKDRREAFGRAIQACPECFYVRASMLSMLQPRWGGSDELMERFVRSHAAREGRNPKLGALRGYVAYYRCKDHLRDDEHAEAVQACTSALEAGEQAVFRMERANALVRLDEVDEALEDVHRALVLRPQQLPLLETAYFVWQRGRRWVEASEPLFLALQLDPTHPYLQSVAPKVAQGLTHTAWKLAEGGDLAQANELMERATHLAPEDESTRTYRERIRRGDPYAARKGVEGLLADVRSHPDDFDAHLRLDHALARNREFDRVVALWTEYLKRHADDARAYLERGGAHFQSGNLAAAEKDAARACQLGLQEGCQRAEQVRSRR
jgi:tetratricopeptide (TPR) repeat protein